MEEEAHLTHDHILEAADARMVARPRAGHLQSAENWGSRAEVGARNPPPQLKVKQGLIWDDV